MGDIVVKLAVVSLTLGCTIYIPIHQRRGKRELISDAEKPRPVTPIVVAHIEELPRQSQRQGKRGTCEASSFGNPYAMHTQKIRTSVTGLQVAPPNSELLTSFNNAIWCVSPNFKDRTPTAPQLRRS